MNSELAMKTTPKDFFLWLAGMATLYVSVVSFIMLLFEYIDILFPDELHSSFDPFSGAIRFAIASLIVLFPLYIFFTRVLNQQIRKNPGKEDIWVRRWLIWITLFVAGITLVVDLVALINTFLGGEITTRFVFKVLVIFIVIGAVFAYYLLDLRGYWKKHEKKAILVGGSATVLALVSIIAGFFIIGTPQDQRLVRLDLERVEDLRTIQSQTLSFWQNTDRLPENLEELEDPLVGFRLPADPVTEEPYTYRKEGALTFELCAVFTTESTDRPKSLESPSRVFSIDDTWVHGVGETCFTRTIDPERFPKRGA